MTPIPLPRLQSHLQPVGRQGRAHPFRPFDQAKRRRQGLLKTQLQNFIGGIEPIEIDMPYGIVAARSPARGLVNLNQGEAGARHRFDRHAAGPGASLDQTTGKGRLAGAKRARQGDHITRPEHGQKPQGQGLGGIGIGQVGGKHHPLSGCLLSL